MTMREHSEAIAAAISSDENLCAQALATFGVPLLVTLGSWFGPDKELGIEHAPFVAIVPGDAEGELVFLRPSGTPVPRAFELRVITGVPATMETVPPLPRAEDRSIACLYTAGSGADGERFHMAAVKVATETAASLGLHASAATCSYSGSGRWPLEVFDTAVSFSLPRTLSVGAF